MSARRRQRALRNRPGPLDLVPAPPPLRSEALVRGDQLWLDGQPENALVAYEEGFRSDLQGHLLHKRIVNVLIQMHGPDRPFAYYGLERLDDRPFTIEPHEILGCVTVRDEVDRLPFFLDYYERLGVDRFLVVDNDSRDATRPLLLADPRVHLWRSSMEYRIANFGMAWVDVLLHAYGIGHWSLVVDADEFLYYPDVETRTLHDLCDDLERDRKLVFPTVLLETYPAGPIREAICEPGDNPVEVCPYFDREFFHWRGDFASEWSNLESFAGGVKRRVFGDETYPFLSKVPLFRYAEDRVIPA